jgi:FecR protein
MKRFSFLTAIIATILFSHAAFAGSIGKVVAVLGSPTSSGPSGSQTLKAGSDIFEHDKISVGSGNAQILLSDGTKLVVGPGSTLLIEKYLMRGNNTAQKVSINALRGTFRFITGRSAKSAYKIRTANATIGIRGTGFDFSVAKNTAVAVVEGKVKLCGRRGGCLNLNAGCELGETAPPKLQKLVGKEKASLITERLPFLIYQTGLAKAFRLNINSCRAVVTLYETRSDGHEEEPRVPDKQCTTTPNGTICR